MAERLEGEERKKGKEKGVDGGRKEGRSSSSRKLKGEGAVVKPCTRRSGKRNLLSLQKMRAFDPI